MAAKISTGDIPENVMKGFAEYGANFVALYDYSGSKLGLDYIYGICETPLSLKMSAKWKDSAKTSLAKKLLSIEGKAADIAQGLIQKDLSVVNAGDTTYSRYAGVDELSYDVQMKLLNQHYTTAGTNDTHCVLSSECEVNNFLARNGLPKVSKKITSTIVNNLTEIAVSIPEKVVNTMAVIKDTAANPKDVNTAISILKRLKDCADALCEKMTAYANDYDTLVKNTLTDYITKQLNSNKTVKRDNWQQLKNDDNITEKINYVKVSSDTTSDEAYIYVKAESSYNATYPSSYSSDVQPVKHTLIGLKTYKARIAEFWNEIVKNNPTEEHLAAFLDFYENEWKSGIGKARELSTGEYEQIKNLSTQPAYILDRLLYIAGINVAGDAAVETRQGYLSGNHPRAYMADFTNLNTRVSSDCEAKINEVKRDIEENALQSGEKKAESKNTLEKLADSFLQVQKPFGELDQRITPCILFYSIGGMIFKDHVLIKSWSQSPDTWGFSTQYNISLEKAEVEDYSTFYNERIFKPNN